MVASVVPLIPAWRVDRTFDYLVPNELAGRVGAGTLVRMSFGHRSVRGIVTEITTEVPDRKLEALKSVSFPVPVAAPPLLDLLDWIARRYIVPRGRAFALAVPPRVRVEVEPSGPPPELPAAARILTYEGGRELIAELRRGTPGTWCLRALPGEPRGDLIAELAGAARGAVLVASPEVRFGSPVLDRLHALVPDAVRTDSTGPEAARAAGVARLAAGHSFGLGGRALVTASAPNLGLIVLDDEANPAYKEERAPAYDARVVARERARRQGAACVFVSAAPSVELGAGARAGTAGSVHPARADERAVRPLVEVTPAPSDRALGPELHSRVATTLASGGRVALLAPRRGYARSMWCGNCRKSLRCPVCEAGLFYDRGPGRVRCARCGYRAVPPRVCPSCGADEWMYLGVGSERLGEQVAAAFPRARVQRVDPDVVEGALPTGPADIYVTTWIGTKAVLRPNVSLVGVVNADVLIRRSGFRAAERAYQALVELSEWAGPAAAGGRLVIQTAEPRHHAVQAAVRADYSYFLRHELESRRELHYPPFSELIRIAARGPERGGAIDDAAAASRRAGARVIGPARVGDSLELLVKCRSAQTVAEELRAVAIRTPRGTRLHFDVDAREP